MTLREALQIAEVQLRAGLHPARARLDAEALLLHLTGKSRAWLLTHAADPFGGCTATQFAALLQRRLTGEPIQYITGTCEFYGLPFRVTRDVLIPRPETEHLVESAIQLLMSAPSMSSAAGGRHGWESNEPQHHTPSSTPELGAPGLDSETWESTVLTPAALISARHNSPAQILDVGTGSGAIAIALAHHLPHTRITATDLSPAALALARENAQRNQVVERIRFLHGDLLAPVAGERFNLIVSNPPYVPASDRDTLDPEVRDHEPHAALFAGDDGLAVYRRLIPAAFVALVPGGWLLLEIGYGQSESVSALCAVAGFHRIATTPDLQGIPRVVAAAHR
jgi:release factor glutamine methyltransferase